MKRRKLPPDTRPDWRDPALPCIRDYRFGNGERRTEIAPDYERRYREMLMETTTQPDWKSDPTYHLRKDRRK